MLLFLCQEICLPVYVKHSYAIHSTWDNVDPFTDYQTKTFDRLFEIPFCSQQNKNAQHDGNVHLNCQQIRLPI